MTKLAALSATTLVAVAGAAVPALAKGPATSAKGKPAKTTTTTTPAAAATKAKTARPLPAAIKDCAADGDLDKVYSPGALKTALKRVPADLGAYTYCPDVLRFARAAGPVVPVSKKKGARLKARCTGKAYDVTISVDGKQVGAGTVPACATRKVSKIVRIPVTATGASKAKRHKLATIVAKPDGKVIQFVVRLRGEKLFS